MQHTISKAIRFSGTKDYVYLYSKTEYAKVARVPAKQFFKVIRGASTWKRSEVCSDLYKEVFQCRNYDYIYDSYDEEFRYRGDQMHIVDNPDEINTKHVSDFFAVADSGSTYNVNENRGEWKMSDDVPVVKRDKRTDLQVLLDAMQLKIVKTEEYNRDLEGNVVTKKLVSTKPKDKKPTPPPSTER